MMIWIAKSALKKHPAFVIREAERAIPDTPEHPAVLDVLRQSLEKMERIGESLDKLILTQESISRELATLARHTPQADFIELRHRLAEDYFPVMDELRRLARALREAADGTPGSAAILAPLAEGSRIVEQRGTAYLEAMGVRAIPSLGEVFDRGLHQAIGMREVSQELEGCIVEEVVRGYRMGGKVLRSAQVIVGRSK
jgi:molecular chaperone GrpE